MNQKSRTLLPLSVLASFLILFTSTAAANNGVEPQLDFSDCEIYPVCSTGASVTPELAGDDCQEGIFEQAKFERSTWENMNYSLVRAGNVVSGTIECGPIICEAECCMDFALCPND